MFAKSPFQIQKKLRGTEMTRANPYALQKHLFESKCAIFATEHSEKRDQTCSNKEENAEVK